MLTRLFFALALLVAFAHIPLAQGQTTVRINEFLASNSSFATDEDGEFSDWIELHNFGAAPVNLNGWFLSDDEELNTKWRLPSVSIPAGGYLLVFASGKERTTPRLHSNFSLSAAGEYLALFRPDGVTAASVYAPFGQQYEDISYGLDSTSQNRYFISPTPGAPNSVSGFVDVVDKPRFSVKRGFYDAPFTLTLSSETPGATVRYTTNGVAPSLSIGSTYSGPIQISGTSTIRARAFRDGWQPSEAETHTYLFVNDIVRQAADGRAPAGWPTSWGQNVVNYGMDPEILNHSQYGPQLDEALKSIPTFSIVMNLADLFDPGSGIYANPGQDGRTWERPCSLELIYPDGRDGFQIGAGIRIRGGFSRSGENPKHAFRLFFREEYGAGKLEYPVFGPDGADEFDKFDLRTFQNYSWSFQGDSRGVFIRDQFSRDTQLDMGRPAERGDYYHLYINGMYWGLYNSCERPEAAYGESYFGGDDENFDVVKVEAGSYTINATDGNMQAWTNLYYQARTGLTNNAEYFKVQGRNPDGSINTNYPVLVDVPNLIDYMLIIIFGGNLDAPISNFLGNDSPNNFYAIRDRLARDGFRFISHDAEHTLLNLSENRTGPYTAGNSSWTKSNPQWVWQKMSANAEFRLLVADHIHRHFFNGGVLTPEAAKARFNERVEEIRLAVIAESARWGDSKTGSPLMQSHWQNSVNAVLTYFNQRSSVVLNQLKTKGLYPATVAPTFTQNGGNVPKGFALSMSAPAGVIYYTIDGTDPHRLGGSVSPSAKIYSSAIPINESVVIKARARTAAGVWSALQEGQFSVIQTFTELVITEIMYNPPQFEGVDGDSFEFIELKNSSNRDLDVSGVTFGVGIDFTFPYGTRLQPGEFAVLASDGDAFARKYPGVRLAGVYTNNLSNGGESISLLHGSGSVLVSFSYSDDPPWPVSADGSGFSLTLVNPNVAQTPTEASAWRASSQLGGSPGRDDAVLNIPAILVTEVLTHTDLPAVDTIELHNPTAAAVDIGNWYLTDSLNTPQKFRIPAGTTIAAGGYLTFGEAAFQGGATGFNLDSHGESVYLFSGDGNGVLTGYSHGFSFGAAANGVSFGRHVTSVGEVHYPAQRQATLGTANAGPLIGPVIINELRYAPFGGSEEFIEIRNVSASTVSLFDPAFPTNRWRINGVDFEFPAGVQLAAGEIAVIAGSDPNLFASRYGIPAGGKVYGPYNGSLQDGGEMIQLLRPDSPDGALVPYIVVDEVRYDDTTPWPVNAFDPDHSLERINTASYGNDPASWRASAISASPGFDNDANRPPRVNGGGDVQISSVNFPASTPLVASITDDGLPAGNTPTLEWSLVTGPGPVRFADATKANTIAYFQALGIYTLRVQGSDGALSSYDEISVEVTRPSGPITILPTRSVWKYKDDGSNQGTAWRSRTFADSAWSQGQGPLGYDNGEVTTLGYGPDSGNKFLTYYFRRSFTVSNAAGVQALTARLMRDDGAVVYINGTEALRVNMPEGVVGHLSRANSAIGGTDETTYTDHPLDTGALVDGENVVAVEMHQVSGNSSDLSFDLGLIASVFPDNARPSVSAGADHAITLPAQASLNGTSTDDALPVPPGALTTTWTKISGPGTVTFDNAGLPATRATFSAPGTYVLRLTATDGVLSAQDEVSVQVTGGAVSEFDQWRQAHFAGAELDDPNVSGSTADPDHDGHDNNEEFIAGTDPRNASSVLQLAAVKVGGGTALRVQTVAGKSYSILATPTLNNPAWTKVADIEAGAGGVVERSDPNQAADSRFYRIVTPKLP